MIMLLKPNQPLKIYIRASAYLIRGKGLLSYKDKKEMKAICYFFWLVFHHYKEAKRECKFIILDMR